MAATRSADPHVGEMLDVLQRAFERSAEPMTVSKLQKQLTGPYRQPADKLAELLEEQVAAGRFFRFAPYGSKSPRFWHQDHAQYARQEMLRELEKSPLSATALQQKLTKRVADCLSSTRKAILEQLVSERVVHSLPPVPGGRTIRYATGPPDPADYVRTFVNTLVRQVGKQAERLAAVHVAPQTTWQAARQMLEQRLREVAASSAPAQPLPSAGQERDAAASDPAAAHTTWAETAEPGPLASEKVLAQLKESWQQRSSGGPMSLRELRQRWWPSAQQKPEVDAALLALARAGDLTLFRHDYPNSMTDVEREQYVTDGAGNFYNALALK